MTGNNVTSLPVKGVEQPPATKAELISAIGRVLTETLILRELVERMPEGEA